MTAIDAAVKDKAKRSGTGRRARYGSIQDECFLLAEKICRAQRFDNKHGYDAHAATELGNLLYQWYREMQAGVRYASEF